MTNNPKTIAEFVASRNTVAKNGRYLKINGATCTKDNLKEYFDVKIEGALQVPEILSYLQASDAVKKGMLTDAYESLMAMGQHNTANAALKSSLGEGISLEDLIPCCDLYTNRKFLFNNKLQAICSFQYDAILDSLPNDAKAEFKAQTQLVTVDYNPYSLDPFEQVETEGFNVLRVNLYKAPEWRKTPLTPEEDASLAMPTIFKEFFEKLMPDPAVREFFYNWVYQAIISRNETVAVFNGTKGIGKGITISIISKLVGDENAMRAPEAALSKEFNSFLRAKRFIYFDEVEVGKHEHTKLKSYTNDKTTIEAKGENADKQEQTYNSFMIANNDTSDMYLEVDDRRFSVLECTDIPLRLQSTPEWRDQLIAAIDDPEQIRQLGYWILKYGKCDKYDEFSAWKHTNFFNLVYTSLLLWQKFIVDTCLEAEDQTPISLSDLSYQFGKVVKGSRLPQKIKILDFLKNYQHLGDIPVADIEKVDGEYSLVPTEDIIAYSKSVHMGQEEAEENFGDFL